MPETTTEKLERLFVELMDFLKTGEFKKHEVDFMVKFLESALASAKKLQAKANT